MDNIYTWLSNTSVQLTIEEAEQDFNAVPDDYQFYEDQVKHFKEAVEIEIEGMGYEVVSMYNQSVGNGEILQGHWASKEEKNKEEEILGKAFEECKPMLKSECVRLLKKQYYNTVK
jgi:hypothetical protein